MFYSNTWNRRGVEVIFEGAPVLKYAQDVRLHSPAGLCFPRPWNNSEAFMCKFVGMKLLLLDLDEDVFSKFIWTFLRQGSARDLRRIAVYVRPSDP